MTIIQPVMPVKSNNNLHYSVARKNVLKNDYKIQLVSTASDIRKQVETFI